MRWSTCSKWVHLRCSLLSFYAFGSSLMELSSWLHLCFSLGLPQLPTLTYSGHPNTCTLIQSGPFGPCSANAAPPHLPRPQRSYPSFAHFVTSHSAPPCYVCGCSSTPPLPLPPLTCSGIFNGMLGAFKLESRNSFSTLSRFAL